MFQLVEIANQHDAVQHGHPEQGDKTNARRDAEWHATQFQSPDAANGGKWDGGKYQRSLGHRTKGEKEEDKNECQRQRHGYHQAGVGGLQVFKLAPVGKVIARWKLDLGIQFRLDFFHQCFDIGIPHVHADDNPAVGVFPRNLHGGVNQFHIRNGLQWHLCAVVQGDVQVLNIAKVFAVSFIQPYHQIEAPFAFVNNPGTFPGKGSPDHLVDLLHLQAVLRHFIVLEIDDDLRHADGLLDIDRAHPVNFGNDFFSFLGLAVQQFQILPVQLDGDVGLGACHQFVKTQLDRL